MHYFSGKGCSESLESMHYCIGILIFEAVWEDEYLYDSNTIMVYISKLRDYIEEDSKNPQFIITVRGLGYKFGK